MLKKNPVLALKRQSSEVKEKKIKLMVDKGIRICLTNATFKLSV